VFNNAEEAIDRYLKSVITADSHPDIAAVAIATDEAALCRVRIDFIDGSSFFIGIGGRR
jgi:hypothetical protein